MGRWTLAHTESLCSEKFHTALKKPLSQSGMKMEEFFEAFDPQDPLVQKLIGALVNDAVRRKAQNKSSGRIAERSSEAARYIARHPEPYTVHPRTRTTIRARRRHEQASAAEAANPVSPWLSAYPPPRDLADVTSSSSLNLFDAYNPSAEDLEDELMHPQESSGEYWWRQAQQGTVPASDAIHSLPIHRGPDSPPAFVQSDPASPRRLARVAQQANRWHSFLSRSSAIRNIPSDSPSNDSDAPSSTPSEEDARTDVATVTEQHTLSSQPFEYEHRIASFTPYSEYLRPEAYVNSRMFRSPSPIPSTTLVVGGYPTSDEALRR